MAFGLDEAIVHADTSQQLAYAVVEFARESLPLFVLNPDHVWNVSCPHVRDYHLLLDEQVEQISQ
jgi:hypothetical protein